MLGTSVKEGRYLFLQEVLRNALLVRFNGSYILQIIN